ncbi:VOC family protein [Sphingobium sp. AN641]|uniref:VOC family protein n=1 Tax=Sphingobium sp. AN641 TaxID=3133443 RepID=UPI0030BD2C22
MYKSNEIMQIAYVVDDLDAAIERWRSLIDTGPFFVFRDSSPEIFKYRGQQSEVRLDIAIGQVGPVQVEFVQPKMAGPNIWRDGVAAGAQGFHHQCYVTDDLQAEIARYAQMGVELGVEAQAGPIAFAYFDTRHLIGSMTEVVQRCEAFDGLCKMIADAAVDWDGSDPVRVLG